jgi:zinc/manganese transport system permease protein
VSTFVTTISFVIYLTCRAIGARRGRNTGRVAVTA